MHLHELMGWQGPMTHRQHSAWQAWLDMQWDVPDRHDAYLQQVAFEVHRANLRVKKPNKAKIGKFRLKFDRPRKSAKKDRAEPESIVEQEAKVQRATDKSKAFWNAMFANAQRKVPIKFVTKRKHGSDGD